MPDLGEKVEEPSSFVFKDNHGSMVFGVEDEEPSSIVEDDRDLCDDHAVPQFSVITEFDSHLVFVQCVQDQEQEEEAGSDEQDRSGDYEGEAQQQHQRRFVEVEGLDPRKKSVDAETVIIPK